MPLEATMVCLDNSEWMRNGDYTPTRMEAQHDAANLVCGTKINQNPESTVGVLTMAGSGVEVLTSPTDDMGKILAACAGVRIGGKCDFAAGLRIAQLALKHRKNKNGGQRIVVFVGSPIHEDEKKLAKIAKTMKKSNVSVDIVLMGEIEVNEEKLRKFVDTVNKNSGSHLVVIPSGVLPSDVLISSPIVTGDESGAAGGGGGGGAGAFAEYGGVDPSIDPELALALRVSMEEARAEAERKTADSGEEKSAAEPVTAAATTTNEAESEEELLNRALLMSMQPEGGDSAGGEANGGDDDDDEEEALRLAIAMSKGESDDTTPSQDTAAAPAAPSSSDSGDAPFLNESFVQQIVSDLPGVDITDPSVMAAMAQFNKGDDKKDDKKDGKKKDDK